MRACCQAPKIGQGSTSAQFTTIVYGINNRNIMESNQIDVTKRISLENNASKWNWSKIEVKKGTNGYGANEKYYGDLWKFEIAKKRWSKVSKPSQNSPSPRHSHQAVVYNGEMYVYGGISRNGGATNDLWSYKFDRQTWTDLKSIEHNNEGATMILARWGHSMVLFNGSIVVFGGAGNDGKVTNDITVIDCGTLTVTAPVVESAELPPPRQYASMVTHDNAIYLFGGYNGHDSLNDFYRITLVDNRVVCASLAVPAFVHKLRGASLSLLPYHSQLLLFGGQSNQQLSGASHLFSLDSYEWREYSSIGPSPRCYHQTCRVNGRVYLFGGLGTVANNDNSENLNDLWIYTGEAPTSEKLMGPTSQTLNIESVPVEIWISILEQLDGSTNLGSFYSGRNIASMATVSKQFNHIVRNSQNLSNLLDSYIQSQNIVIDDINDGMLHLVLIGQANSGKSATTVQFVNGVFVARYDPTIEDTFRKHSQVDGIEYLLNVTDTAGPFYYAAEYIHKAHGVYAVYSITSRESLNELRKILDFCQTIKGKKFPLIICGNKCDLEEQRQVSQDEGKALAREYGGIWMETSAKTAHNNFEAFTGLIRQVVEAFRIQSKRKAKAANASNKKDKCLVM